MLAHRASSTVLRTVIVDAPEKIKAIDAEYKELVRGENVSMSRIKTNRSKRWWVLKDVEDCTYELTQRGEESTIPLWAKKKLAAVS